MQHTTDYIIKYQLEKLYVYKILNKTIKKRQQEKQIIQHTTDYIIKYLNYLF